MDNLVTLIDKKQYKLVLDLTEDSDDPKSLYCRISAYLGLGEAHKAMDILLKKRDILYQDSPLKCLKANFELRFLLKQYDEAYLDAEYFSSLPYVSQEVEEELRSLNKKIRYNERQSSLKEKYSEEDVEEILLHKHDPYEIMSLLSSFTDSKTIYYAHTLAKMIEKTNSNIVKTYALMLLVKAKTNKDVVFVKNGITYVITPSHFRLPYEEEKAKSLLADLQKEMKDPSLFNIAKNIVNNLMFELYPERIFEIASNKILLVSLVNISHSYFQSDFNDEELLTRYKLKKKDVAKATEKILSILQNAEQIKV